MPLHLIALTLIPHFWSWYIPAFFSFETIQFCVLFCRSSSIRILNCEYDREITHEIDWKFEQALFHESIIYLSISEKVFFRVFSSGEIWKKEKKILEMTIFEIEKKNLIFHVSRYFVFFFVFRFFLFFFSIFRTSSSPLNFFKHRRFSFLNYLIFRADSKLLWFRFWIKNSSVRNIVFVLEICQDHFFWIEKLFD